MRVLSFRAAILALAVGAGLVAAGEGRAQSCPDITLLEYGGKVYRAEALPASSGIGQGGPLGKGAVDAPREDDVCERDREEDVTVVRLDGIAPEVATGVQGRPGTIFVLGSKCYGFEGDARWTCLREPLELAGKTYVATRYPDGAGPTRPLPLAAPLEGATIAGETVAAVEIEGVNPDVAVGLAGRTDEAYVALEPCLYERFDPRPLYDDLRRCLAAPVWFIFEPPGAPPGDETAAEPDRALRPELGGATVALARSTVAADVVPDDAAPVIVFTIGSTGSRAFSFTVPELGPGRYEAVLDCPDCATADGKTTFPAGSFLVLEPDRASGGKTLTTIITIAIGLAFVGALTLAVIMWRRGKAAARASGPGEGDDGGPAEPIR